MNDEEAFVPVQFNVRHAGDKEFGAPERPYRMEFMQRTSPNRVDTNTQHASLNELWMFRDRLDRFLRSQT